jgi:hypothetical protein
MYTFGRKPPSAGYSGPWWGARAIYQGTIIDLLADRQSTVGTADERDALERWLKGAIAEMREKVKAERPSTREATVLVIERDGYRLEASPQRSYGYLYLGAWKVPS